MEIWVLSNITTMRLINVSRRPTVRHFRDSGCQGPQHDHDLAFRTTVRKGSWEPEKNPRLLWTSKSFSPCLQESIPARWFHPISLRSILIPSFHLHVSLSNCFSRFSYKAECCMYFLTSPWMLHVLPISTYVPGSDRSYTIIFEEQYKWVSSC